MRNLDLLDVIPPLLMLPWSQWTDPSIKCRDLTGIKR